MTYRLERTQVIPRPRHEVFAFFSRPENLEQITPPFLGFRILTPSPVPMHEGASIDYRLRLFGLPLGWQAVIRDYEPDVGFTDVQQEGPYRLWHHRHEFEDAEGGTLMRDVVDYELPLGPLGAAAHALAVRSTLNRIFDYRFKTIEEILS